MEIVLAIPSPFKLFPLAYEIQPIRGFSHSLYQKHNLSKLAHNRVKIKLNFIRLVLIKIRRPAEHARPAAAFFNFNILQQRRFDAEAKIKTLAETRRRPEELHFPTVQIARNRIPLIDDAFLPQIKLAIKRDVPIFRQSQTGIVQV